MVVKSNGRSASPARFVSLLVCAMMVAGLLAGCAGEQTTPAPPATPTPAPQPPGPTLNGVTTAGLPATATATPQVAALMPVSTPAALSPTVTPLSSPSPLPVVGTVVPSEHDTAETDADLEAAPAPPNSGGGMSGQAGNNGERPNTGPLNTAVPTPTRPPLKANYGAKGNPKVGIQAGHWLIENLPAEQANLRTQTGGAGGGVREVDYNLDIARRVTRLLQDKDIEVDLLPATVPAGYAADAFVSIHADATLVGGPGGFKLARSRFSAIPVTDDALLNWLYSSYEKATGLRRDSNITRNMTGYYAFNSRRRVHAVAKHTPAVIIEMGYLTHPGDVAYLISNRDAVARGIADGITSFLNNRLPLDKREKPAEFVRGIEVARENTVILAEPGGATLAQAIKGQQFEYSEASGDYFSVFVPVLNKRGYIRRSDVTFVNIAR